MKKILFLLIIIVNTLLFLFAPNQAVEAAKNGLLLWFYQIVPTLFPWTILSNIVINSNLVNSNNASQQHFINKAEAIVLFCGFLFGFPIGSKLTADFYQANLINRKRAQILCACANQFSFSFVRSFVMAQILQLNHHTGIYLTILYAPSFVLGISFLIYDSCVSKSRASAIPLCGEHLSDPAVRRPHFAFRQLIPPCGHTDKKTASRFQINMQIIDTGIINGFEALIKLCGYIVMFSILVTGFQMIFQQNTLTLLLINNLLETTSGIAKLSAVSVSHKLKYVISIAALNWGGLSCMAQTGSIISNTDLSLLQYTLFKFTVSIISAATAAICLLIFGIC